MVYAFRTGLSNKWFPNCVIKRSLKKMASGKNTNETAIEMTDLTEVANKNLPLSGNVEVNVTVIQEEKHDDQAEEVEEKGDAKHTIAKAENVTETGIEMTDLKMADKDQGHMHIEADVLVIEEGNGKDKFHAAQRNTGML